MHHCNTNRHSSGNSNDKQAMQLQSDVENIKNTIDMNIELLMERSVKLEDLMEQSDELLMESQAFNEKSNQLKKVMRRKVWRYKLILITFAVLTLYLMMVKMCGFDLSCESDYHYSNNNQDNNNNDNNNGGYYDDDGNINDQNNGGYYNYNDDGNDQNNGGYYNNNNGDDGGNGGGR